MSVDVAQAAQQLASARQAERRRALPARLRPADAAAAYAIQIAVERLLGKQGIGTHAVGNPLRLLAWLVNHARERGGIAAETVVTTGAWLGLHPVQPGDEVIVEFPAIGEARVSIAQT